MLGGMRFLLGLFILVLFGVVDDAQAILRRGRGNSNHSDESTGILPIVERMTADEMQTDSYLRSRQNNRFNTRKMVLVCFSGDDARILAACRNNYSQLVACGATPIFLNDPSPAELRKRMEQEAPDFPNFDQIPVLFSGHGKAAPGDVALSSQHATPGLRETIAEESKRPGPKPSSIEDHGDPFEGVIRGVNAGREFSAVTETDNLQSGKDLAKVIREFLPDSPIVFSACQSGGICQSGLSNVAAASRADEYAVMKPSLGFREPLEKAFIDLFCKEELFKQVAGDDHRVDKNEMNQFMCSRMGTRTDKKTITIYPGAAAGTEINHQKIDLAFNDSAAYEAWLLKQKDSKIEVKIQTEQTGYVITYTGPDSQKHHRYEERLSPKQQGNISQYLRDFHETQASDAKVFPIRTISLNVTDPNTPCGDDGEYRQTPEFTSDVKLR